MKKVLVIEDNQDNFRLISYALRRNNYEVIWAERGEEGIELAKRELPFFIILDVNLPGIDGLEVAKRIRSWEGTKKTFLIAITSYALAGDKEKIMSAGFNGYFEKPIDPLTIVKNIHEIIQRGGILK